MNVADRTKSINLELLEEMFQIEEKEKVVNAGKLNVQESGISEQTSFKMCLMLDLILTLKRKGKSTRYFHLLEITFDQFWP